MLSEVELLSQPADAYLNADQQAFFQQLLLAQWADLQQRISAEFEALRDVQPSSDPADQGSNEEQREWQLRQLKRQKRLLDKLEQALDRLARNEYGWCLETGEPIGLKRLLRRPTATLCIEAKEREELRDRHQRAR